MQSPDPLAEPARALSTAARGLVLEIRASASGQALARLSASYRVLTGKALPLGALFEEEESQPVAQLDGIDRDKLERSNVERLTGVERSPRRSVRDRLHDLLAEVATPLTYDDVISIYQSRQDPIVAADVKAALRNAAASLVTDGFVVRVDDGRFQIATTTFVEPVKEVG